MKSQVLETYFWQQVKGGLESLDTHLSRVENTAGTGISDVTACHQGIEVWLELKIVHSKRLYFKNSQRIWIAKRTAVGGNVKVVARKDSELFVWDARPVVLDCPHTPSTDNKAFSIKEDDMPAPLYHCRQPFNWREIKATIFGKSANQVKEGS
jgi:hypothetical protein